MPRFPMDRKVLQQPVTLEYDEEPFDDQGRFVSEAREVKQFKNSFEARKAYARLLREGRNPKVITTTHRS